MDKLPANWTERISDARRELDAQDQQEVAQEEFWSIATSVFVAAIILIAAAMIGKAAIALWVL